MARIKYSGLVTEIAGSIGGTTFQRNAYGFTIKNKPNMVKPVRPRQIVRKVRFQTNVQRWRELTQANRDAWIAYATTYPVPSRLNPSSNLNGFNLFCRYHNYLSIVFPNNVLADPGGAPVSLSAISNDVYISSGSLNWNSAVTIPSGDWLALMYLTRPQGAGQTFVQDTPVFIEYNVNPGTGVEDITASYEAIFGDIPTVDSFMGQKVVFVREDAAQVLIIPTAREEVEVI